MEITFQNYYYHDLKEHGFAICPLLADGEYVGTGVFFDEVGTANNHLLQNIHANSILLLKT